MLNTKFTFGSPNTTTSTGIFGQQSTTAQPSTSQQSTGLFASFGKPTATATLSTPATTGFSQAGFGQTNKPLFGQTTTTTTTNQPLNSNFGGFGTKIPSSSTFNFGATTSSQLPTSSSLSSNLGGFGSGSSNQTVLGIPQQTQSSTLGTQSLFPSLQSQQNTSLGGLANVSTGLNLQASTYGIANQTATTTSTSNSALDQDQYTLALVNPQAFNDERDTILSKWNQLQSFYGFGKVFYQNSVLDVNKENKYTRFKTIGYNSRPTHKEEDGLVSLIVNQKVDLVKTNQKSITDCLHKIFNNDQSLAIKIDSIKQMGDDKTEVIIYVEQKQSMISQETKRISCMLLFNHLNKQENQQTGGLLGSVNRQPTIKQQLEQINVVNLYPLLGFTDDQIKNYLENPPLGVNPSLWDHAKKNNPNPKKTNTSSNYWIFRDKQKI